MRSAVGLRLVHAHASELHIEENFLRLDLAGTPLPLAQELVDVERPREWRRSEECNCSGTSSSRTTELSFFESGRSVEILSRRASKRERRIIEDDRMIHERLEASSIIAKDFGGGSASGA